MSVPASSIPNGGLATGKPSAIIGRGQYQAIVSLPERKSKLTLIKKIQRMTADAVQAAITALLSEHKALVHTITSDSGREFAHHKATAKSLTADFYFAHPYCSWE